MYLVQVGGHGKAPGFGEGFKLTEDSQEILTGPLLSLYDATGGRLKRFEGGYIDLNYTQRDGVPCRKRLHIDSSRGKMGFVLTPVPRAPHRAHGAGVR